MRKKIVVLWVIGCLAVSSAKAQFNTVSNNVYRYKVRKVEEKFLLPANQPVDSIQANLLQQETGSVDSKQKQSWHNGLDLRAKNEPAYSMMEGIVEKIGYDSRSGNYVTLKHGNYHVSYCHLSSVIVGKGERVFSGTIVGVTGNTGRSTGCHLHLTCKKNGESFNPTILLNLIEKSFALSALSMRK